MWLEGRRLRREPGAVAEWPVVDFRLRGVRRTALLITALTAVNVVILLLAGYGSLHWMESPTFCGQVCHAPMHPQFAAWQAGSHARTACVRCHVGAGAGGFVHAKLNGVHQLVAVATGSVPQPIPPGAHMPPGAQALTCNGCHKTTRVVGDKIQVIREFADDEANTETMTVLQMFVGDAASSGRAIHKHVDPSRRIEYVSTDETHQTIPYVKVSDADGRVKEFIAEGATEEAIRAGERRVMDCIDCHNTVGHPISQTPERAVDQAIAAGLVSRELPFVRREGVRLLTAAYPNQDEGVRAIERGLRSFYESRGGVDQQAVARSVSALQDVYRHNVFPAMNVTWGTYPTNRGHLTSTGCFRCHDDTHKAKDGSVISGDCEWCHKQIERPGG
jgi:nitrate/TMAO reductase-like tetraheme cytochrome c subunit